MRSTLRELEERSLPNYSVSASVANEELKHSHAHEKEDPFGASCSNPLTMQETY